MLLSHPLNWPDWLRHDHRWVTNTPHGARFVASGRLANAEGMLRASLEGMNGNGPTIIVRASSNPTCEPRCTPIDQNCTSNVRHVTVAADAYATAHIHLAAFKRRKKRRQAQIQFVQHYKPNGRAYIVVQESDLPPLLYRVLWGTADVRT